MLYAVNADENVLTLSHKNLTLEENLNQELCEINDWLKNNHLSLNTSKYQIFVFYQSKE